MARDASVAGQSEEHDIFQNLGQGHTHEGFLSSSEEKWESIAGF